MARPARYYRLTDGSYVNVKHVAETVGISEPVARNRLTRSRDREVVMRPREGDRARRNGGGHA